MNKKTVTRFKWWWAWNYEEQEQWLTNMSQLGYKMIKSKLGVFFTFEVGNFEEYVYKIDYKKLRGKKLYEYIQLFNDCGWEYIDSLMGWHYFRKKDSNIELPELYTDSESKAQIFKQLLGTMIALLVMYIPILIFFIYALVTGKISPGRNNEALGIFIFDIVIYVFDTLFFAYVFSKLMNRYRKLKKKYL